jgi:hypothetical protein
MVPTAELGLSKEDRDLVEGVIAGRRRALAKAITLVESTRADHQQRAQGVLGALLPETGKSIRIGISGVPGVGKSTFIEALGMYLIERGHKLAVLAVDPSSSVTGGSILGDKTRMELLVATRGGLHPPLAVVRKPGRRCRENARGTAAVRSRRLRHHHRRNRGRWPVGDRGGRVDGLLRAAAAAECRR